MAEEPGGRSCRGCLCDLSAHQHPAVSSRSTATNLERRALPNEYLIMFAVSAVSAGGS